MSKKGDSELFPLEHCQRKSHHPEKLKINLISRLNRLEGQIRGVKRLIEGDTYCDDILHQISSIQSSLSGFSHQLLEYHFKSCIVEQIKEGKLEVHDEFLKTIKKLKV